MEKGIIPTETIEQKIFLVREKKVMIDQHLAFLYNVPTMVLNQAVKRNSDRFPEDFMFQLTHEEYKTLISQIVISKKGRGGVRKLPHVFTEQGIAMLSSVLRSPRAIAVNIQIIRTFTKLREFLKNHDDLIQKINTMEKKYDSQFRTIFDVIRRLIEDEKKPPRKIGF